MWGFLVWGGLWEGNKVHIFCFLALTTKNGINNYSYAFLICKIRTVKANQG